MATVADRVLDNGLTVLDVEANAVHITSQQATTFAEATSTYTLGNTTSISISAPTDRTGGGRQVTLTAVTGASVTASGTATHYAIVDTSNSRLLVTSALTASQSVTSGNTFSLEALDVGIPDPT
tara:strand:- start:13465 stop:13836 length:372 start_codon:yes stop_codon:yes gene_type:complete